MSEKQGVRETDTRAWLYLAGLRDYLLQSLAVEPLVPLFEGAQYAGAQEAEDFAAGEGASGCVAFTDCVFQRSWTPVSV